MVFKRTQTHTAAATTTAAADRRSLYSRYWLLIFHLNIIVLCHYFQLQHFLYVCAYDETTEVGSVPRNFLAFVISL